MRADVSERTRRAAACGVSTPLSLFLSSCFQRGGEPVLHIFNLHQSNRAKFSRLHHFARLPHQGMSGVVMCQAKNEPGASHGSGKIQRVLEGGRERFVANNVNARLK